MNRIIIDYNKLTNEILKLLIEKYPDGYSNSEIISFKNLKGETVKAIELRDSETIYLVKVSSQLEKTIDDLIEDDNFFENDSFFEDDILNNEIE